MHHRRRRGDHLRRALDAGLRRALLHAARRARHGGACRCVRPLRSRLGHRVLHRAPASTRRAGWRTRPTASRRRHCATARSCAASAWATSCSTAGAARSTRHIAVHSAATERGAALHAARQVRPAHGSDQHALCRRVARHRQGDLARRHDGRVDHHGPRARSDRADRRPVEAHRRLPDLLQPPAKTCSRRSRSAKRRPPCPRPKATSKSRTR